MQSSNNSKAIKMIDWPPNAPQNLTNGILNIVRNAVQLYGDVQATNVQHIVVGLKSQFGGNWSCIMCPVDEKSYNIHYQCETTINLAYTFTFEREGRRYLIWKYPVDSNSNKKW